MMIPNFENVPIVKNGGYLSDQWSLILQQLISYLQQNIGNEGFRVPNLSAADITKLQTKYNAASDPSAFRGNLVYDTTNEEAKIFIYDPGPKTGTFKVIQVM